jgi:hypothetical protein
VAQAKLNSSTPLTRLWTHAPTASLQPSIQRSQAQGGSHRYPIQLLRVSMSNSFYGQPIPLNTVPQEIVQQILGQLSISDFKDINDTKTISVQMQDSTYRYVEVSWADYQQLNPNFSQMRNPTPLIEKEEKKQVVNTYNLLDNCYYVALAACCGTTVQKLMERTEEMQVIGGIPSLGEMSRLVESAGLNGRHHPCNSLGEVESMVAKLAKGLDKNFILAYSRTSGPGHMIVVHYDASEQTCTYKDYQPNSNNNNGVDWHPSREPNLATYHLFES